MQAPGGSVPGTLRLVPAPSRKGTRWLARPDPRLAASFTVAVAGVADRIEAALGPEVVANRVNRSDPVDPVLELEPWSIARARFAAEAARLATAAGALLIADVRACYPSIRAAVVGTALAGLGCSSENVMAVGRVLAAFTSLGVRGLPIGPEPSAVLANAVLASVDQALRATSATHLRWVDDFWVFLPAADGAERVMSALTAGLSRLGLGLAAEKTRFLRGAEVPAACARWPRVSGTAPRYHRRSDAHPVPGIRRAYPVASASGGMDPDRRPTRRARRVG